MQVLGYMGVDMRWIRTSTQVGATLKGSVPFKGELIIDPQDGKLSIKYDQPTQNINLITAKVEPLNFVLLVPSSLQQLPFDYELAFINGREDTRSFVFEVRPQFSQ